MRIRFLTSTPLDIRRGSGTFVGIQVLARALEGLGHTVDFETPQRRLPVYTAQRLLFNRRLRGAPDYELTVGYDMDGYTIASGNPNHVAALKGVIADEVRYERGLTRLTMSIQARCEREHVGRAARVLVTSRYSAERAQEFYGLKERPSIVPELIELDAWRELLRGHPASGSRFTVLFAGRFYRRKRVDVLLRAAAALRPRIPELEVRLVGNGPCAGALRELARELRLDGTVNWLGDVSRSQLAEEYNRASVFCLPSVQEGFGIVLLEAMAAMKPVVAARAGAIPEVAPQATLVEPDNAEALAEGIAQLYGSWDMRHAQSIAGEARVQHFDARAVAAWFAAAATGACAASIPV